MGKTEGFKCYIYGSIHVRFPPLDKIGNIADQVDYVLLEGVGLKKKGSLVIPTFPLWIAFYIYRRLFLYAVHLLHPRMKGKSDMEILKEFFESKGKPVEIADFEFYDLIKQRLREAFILSLLSFIIFITLSHSLPPYYFPIYLILLLSCFILSALICFGFLHA